MTSPLLPGTRISRYEIRAQLGAGGMGEVYLAEDTKLGRKVALKLLPSEFTTNPDRMRRFVKEAKTAAALNHPNIAHIYESGESEARNFIAMEFIDGETLRECLRERRMKVTEVLDIGGQIASALSAAHAAGIIHRDLKPENVMRSRDGIVKVLDFGLAKLIEKAEKEVNREATTKSMMQTKAGELLGTVAYMSPEQARGLSIDERTDIFSLGVVIYEMITGSAPFEGPTTSDLIAAILEREPPPLALFTTETSSQLEWIVTKALTKDRDERYQTAKDLLIDLRRLSHKLAIDAEIKRAFPRDIMAVENVSNLEGALGESKGKGKNQSSSQESDGEPEHIRGIAESFLDKIQEISGRLVILTGISTGFVDLDRLTSGLQPSDLITIVAPPRIGASNLCVNLAKNAALKSEATVVLFSLQRPKDDVLCRILCSNSVVDINRLRNGFLSRSDWASIARGFGELAASKIFIDDSSDLSLRRFREKILQVAKKERIGLVVIDYIQLLSDLWPEEEVSTKSFASVARTLKSLALELRIPIVAVFRVSEPFQIIDDVQTELSELPEYAQYKMFEQISDLVILLSQREQFEGVEDNVVNVSVSKNSHGPTGTIRLEFRKEFALFQSLTELTERN